ncbi:MAG: hypothetical protein IT209_11115 [Armatimonadetes bacterium]|nr:hypothetical protein [Armatimonadota bacterium]
MLFNRLMRTWWLLLGLLVISGATAIGYGAHKLTGVRYRATARLLLAKSSPVAALDVVHLATSSPVTKQAASDLKLDQTALLERLHVEVSATNPRTAIFQGRAATAEEAVELANRVADLTLLRALVLNQVGAFRKQDTTAVLLDSTQKKLGEAAEKLKDFERKQAGVLLPLDYEQAKSQVMLLKQQRDAAADLVAERARRAQDLKDVQSDVSAYLQAGTGAGDSSQQSPDAQSLLRPIEQRLSQAQEDQRDAVSRYDTAARDLARAQKMLEKIPALAMEHKKLKADYEAAKLQVDALQPKYAESTLALRLAQSTIDDRRAIGSIDFAKSATLTRALDRRGAYRALTVGSAVSLVLWVVAALPFARGARRTGSSPASRT